MELILISCCKTKLVGGMPNYKPSLLFDYLGDEQITNLMAARKELANILGFASGIDLGSFNTEGNILYMPAFERYRGYMYEKTGLSTSFPRLYSRQIIIISALYGILHAGDFIRHYDIKMDYKLPNGIKVKTYWKRQGLGYILYDLIRKSNYEKIHNLLPNDYCESLEPVLSWFSQKFLISYKYTGVGNGSIWKRVEQLNKLLKEDLNT